MTLLVPSNSTILWPREEFTIQHWGLRVSIAQIVPPAEKPFAKKEKEKEMPLAESF